MKIYLIRHGETKGNREHRYVGTTDEGLLPEGKLALEKLRMPKVARVYVSPMRRCRETAQILFPDCEPVFIENLRECDFGAFEYKNYEELNGDPDYQRFIDTMGESGFPGGEDMRCFQERCVKGLEEVLELERGIRQRVEQGIPRQMECSVRQQADIALVVHGGTIMALLDRFSEPHKDYYDWQAKNGCGYAAEAVEGADGSFCLTSIVKF